MSNPALHGTWEMIRAELNGENSLELLALRVELELNGTTYLVRFAGEVADHGTYIHHEAGSPARLTIQGTTGPNAGRVIPCIYQLAGDRLRVCYGMDGSAPTAFASPAGSPHYLATYRRKSAGAAPATLSPSPQP